jgi:hypothetical protein
MACAVLLISNALFRTNSILVEDLQDIIQYSDNDARLETSVCHVVTLVGTHD